MKTLIFILGLWMFISIVAASLLVITTLTVRWFMFRSVRRREAPRVPRAKAMLK